MIHYQTGLSNTPPNNSKSSSQEFWKDSSSITDYVVEMDNQTLTENQQIAVAFYCSVLPGFSFISGRVLDVIEETLQDHTLGSLKLVGRMITGYIDIICVITQPSLIYYCYPTDK